RGVVRELNDEGRTVIYTTHIMSEAESLCDRVAIVDHGQVLALGTVPELKDSLGREDVTRIEGVISSAAALAVEHLPGVSRAVLVNVNSHNQLTVAAGDQRALLPRLIETLGAHSCVVQKIAPEEITLEDVFIARTGRTLADDTRQK
ncbi:MAG: DUF4162 domain-containing protein, partial [Anaerolineales bacterium]